MMRASLALLSFGTRCVLRPVHLLVTALVFLLFSEFRRQSAANLRLLDETQWIAQDAAFLLAILALASMAWVPTLRRCQHAARFHGSLGPRGRGLVIGVLAVAVTMTLGLLLTILIVGRAYALRDWRKLPAPLRPVLSAGPGQELVLDDKHPSVEVSLAREAWLKTARPGEHLICPIRVTPRLELLSEYPPPVIRGHMSVRGDGIETLPDTPFEWHRGETLRTQAKVSKLASAGHIQVRFGISTPGVRLRFSENSVVVLGPKLPWATQAFRLAWLAGALASALVLILLILQTLVRPPLAWVTLVVGGLAWLVFRGGDSEDQDLSNWILAGIAPPTRNILMPWLVVLGLILGHALVAGVSLPGDKEET